MKVRTVGALVNWKSARVRLRVRIAPEVRMLEDHDFPWLVLFLSEMTALIRVGLPT